MGVSISGFLGCLHAKNHTEPSIVQQVFPIKDNPPAGLQARILNYSLRARISPDMSFALENGIQLQLSHIFSMSELQPQPAFTCSKSTMEIQEQ